VRPTVSSHINFNLESSVLTGSYQVHLPQLIALGIGQTAECTDRIVSTHSVFGRIKGCLAITKGQGWRLEVGEEKKAGPTNGQAPDCIPEKKNLFGTLNLRRRDLRVLAQSRALGDS